MDHDMAGLPLSCAVSAKCWALKGSLKDQSLSMRHLQFGEKDV